MFEKYDDILTVEEACEALKMGQTFLYKILRNGELKAYKNGTIWRIPKQSLIEYVKFQANGVVY